MCVLYHYSCVSVTCNLSLYLYNLLFFALETICIRFNVSDSRTKPPWTKPHGQMSQSMPPGQTPPRAQKHPSWKNPMRRNPMRQTPPLTKPPKTNPLL